MSPVPQASSAVGRIFAPAATNSSSVIDEPTPASCCDVDLVTVRGQLVHADGRDRHPVLVVLDFLGDADLHVPHSSLTAATSSGLDVGATVTTMIRKRQLDGYPVGPFRGVGRHSARDPDTVRPSLDLVRRGPPSTRSVERDPVRGPCRPPRAPPRSPSGGPAPGQLLGQVDPDALVGHARRREQVDQHATSARATQPGLLGELARGRVERVLARRRRAARPAARAAAGRPGGGTGAASAPGRRRRGRRPRPRPGARRRRGRTSSPSGPRTVVGRTPRCSRPVEPRLGAARPARSR